MKVSTALNIALERWRAEKIDLLPPREEVEVTSILNAAGRQISRDVIQLYCTTGGRVDQAIDSHFWSLWSLGRVAAENAKYSQPYLLFADCMIDSHLYCFKYENSKESSVCIDLFNGEEPQRVADSVNQFFELYVNSPERLELYNF
jgi:thiamine pyrophosphokinase